MDLRGVERDGPRRLLNVAAAGVGLVLTSPLFVLVALAIKLTSRGPIIYTQTRVGIDRRGSRNGNAGNHGRRRNCGGRPFRIYKFRTMRDGDGTGPQAVWASPDDPRVTLLGRLLRKYRLDELPQLINVLRGDMNLVGPRPEQPAIFERLRERIAGYSLRQRVLPGITGWAQVRLHYDRSVEDVKRKVAFDLEYITRRSALEDLRIMALTVPVVVFKKGAW